MRLANTTGDFGKFGMTDCERVRALYDAGFRCVDLSMYQGCDPDWEYLQPGWEKKIEALKQYADDLGMTFVQAHSPGGNPIAKDGSYELLMASTVRSIEICGMLGIENNVFHVGSREDILYTREGEKKFFGENAKVLEELYPAMEKWGVNILIENSAKSNMGERYYFFTGEEMKAFIAYTGHPLVHACWDTGHANIEGHQYDHLVVLGDDLRALHINDNLKGGDEHIMPFMGTVNVDEIMHGLMDAGYKGYFTFECDSTVVNPGYWQGARKRFDRDTRLACVPFEVQLAVDKLLYTTGKCILKTYGLWEEE